jgi:hypothetical protein
VGVKLDAETAIGEHKTAVAKTAVNSRDLIFMNFLPIIKN